jgi:hypothetical protein
MCNLCEDIVNAIWQNIATGQTFRTPDSTRSKTYRISGLEDNHIYITPQKIEISRESFEKAIHYLKTNEHYANNPCEIRSNNDSSIAGPLCRASRGFNHNVRCINYVLPILKAHGIVEINGSSANKTWVLQVD